MKNIIIKINKFFTQIYIQIKKQEFLIKIVLTFLLFYWVFYLSTEKFKKKTLDFKVGDIAPYDVKINKDIEYTDQIETQKAIQNMITNIPLIFSYDVTIRTQEKENLNQFFNLLEKSDKENIPLSEKIKLLRQKSILQDEKDILFFINNYKSDNLPMNFSRILDNLYTKGISDINQEEIMKLSPSDEIIKFYKNENNEDMMVIIKIKDIYFYNEINYSDILKRYFRNMNQEKINNLAQGLRNFIRPNLIFNKTETDNKLLGMINSVKPIKKKLLRKQIIVREGQVITESDFNILKEIIKYTSETNTINGYFILLLSIFVLIFLLIRIYLTSIYDNLKSYIFILSFVFLSLTLNYLFNYFNVTIGSKIPSSLFIPMAGYALLITSLTTVMTSYFVIVIISLLTIFIIGFSYTDFIVILLIGLLTVTLTHWIKKRSSKWYIGILIGILYLIFDVALVKINNLDNSLLMDLIATGFINGIVSVIIMMGLYPLFEAIFNLLTDYKLLELSDLNLPMMKKLLIEAPGTYQHSIITANLAETAALTIGANSLLARVGGYYHDIGKLENPEYFIENQSGDENRHNNIKPSISCSIIKSHIKFGLEVQKKLKLPLEIGKVIQEHHGTTMIHYFYKKALMDKEIEKMSKEDLIAIYRHDGPIPSSKESAIIMLADAVEAATRSLKKPSFSRIETIIREIMNARFLDGQLNDCPLTLRDLEKITESFVQVLSAMYHARIEYPDKKEIEKLENEY